MMQCKIFKHKIQNKIETIKRNIKQTLEEQIMIFPSNEPIYNKSTNISWRRESYFQTHTHMQF